MLRMSPQRLAAALAVCTCLTLPLSDANAQTTRLYLAGYLGLSDFGSNDFDDGGTGTTGELDVDETYVFAGALGLRFSQNLRLEAELSYKNNDITNITVNNNGKFGASGEIESYTGLLNAYYDFDTDSKFKPFLSAGLGIGFHDANITNTSGLASNVNSDDFNFMYQVGAGIKYRLQPDLALTGGYRYLNGTDLEIGTYEIDYGGHELRFGLEYDLPIK